MIEKNGNVEILLKNKREYTIHLKRNIKDFNIGLEVPSKLLPKNIKGGIVLKETTYKMR